MQVVIELDDAQLAGAVATFTEYQKAETRLQRVITSILARSKIPNVLEWKLNPADSQLIVVVPDPPVIPEVSKPEETP